MSGIRPRFYKRIPRNAASFFSSKSDRAFKKQHPLAYKVAVCIGVVALFIPMIGYLAFWGVMEIEISGWFLLGMVGALLFGIGLFNIVAAFVRQYLGHIVTVTAILVGSGLMALSVWLTIYPPAKEWFPPEMVSYYFVSLMGLAVLSFLYIAFRCAYSDWIEAKIKGCGIKKSESSKGIREFLWKTQLHRQVGKGILYYLNKGFTILYGITFLLTLCTGLIRVMSIPIALLSIPLYLLSAVLCGFTNVQNNMEYYGKPVVLLRRNPEQGRIEGLLFDLLGILFYLAILYVQLLMVSDLWNLPFPRLYG